MKESESLTLCGPTDRGLPGSSVLGILQARILQWAVFPSTGDLLYPGTEPGSPDCRQILYHLPRETLTPKPDKTHLKLTSRIQALCSEQTLKNSFSPVLWGQELCLQRQGPLGLSWPPLDPPE